MPITASQLSSAIARVTVFAASIVGSPEPLR